LGTTRVTRQDRDTRTRRGMGARRTRLCARHARSDRVRQALREHGRRTRTATPTVAPPTRPTWRWSAQPITASCTSTGGTSTATRAGPTGSRSEDLMGAPTRSAGRRSIPARVPGSPPPRGHEPKTHQHRHRSLGATPQCRNRYPSGADRIGRLPREPGVSVWWRSHKDGDSPRPRDRVCATRALTASAGQASSRTRATG
jgi:hypothetical protein